MFEIVIETIEFWDNLRGKREDRRYKGFLWFGHKAYIHKIRIQLVTFSSIT